MEKKNPERRAPLFLANNFLLQMISNRVVPTDDSAISKTSDEWTRGIRPKKKNLVKKENKIIKVKKKYGI
jgi:hypothetical protein